MRGALRTLIQNEIQFVSMEMGSLDANDVLHRADILSSNLPEDALRARAAFFERHDVLLSSLDSSREGASNTPPNELHHYTNASALHSILDRGELWATNAHYLNDAEELEIGLAIYNGVVEGARRAKDAQHSERVSGLFDTASLHSEVIRQSLIFVFCLSAAANQLSQWRAYSGHGGYSITFDSEGLAGLRFGEQHLSLDRVLYEPKDQSEKTIDTLASYCAYIDTLDNETWRREGSVLAEVFVNYVHRLLGGMKREAFREEKEWRLIHRDWDYGAPKYSFRTNRAGLIVPYCPLNASGGRLPITRITVGPTNHPDLAVRSVKQLLRKSGYENVDVDFCDIPLREM